MITNNIINAAHLLRMFVWKIVDANTRMDLVPAYVNGRAVTLIPVAPLSDEPLLSNAEPRQTYIIYGFIENESSFGPHRTGTISLRIIAPDFSHLSQVINVLADTFELEDDAAAAVNRWSSQTTDFVGIRFTSVKTSYVEVGDPEIKEGGPVEGVVNLRFRYVREATPITLPA